MVTVVTVHHQAVMHHQQPEKMLRKKKLGAQNFTGRFICLSDKMCDKIPNPIQEEVSKKGRTWTEENCIWFGRYWGIGLGRNNILKA